jgi:hypothetical protein
MTENLERLEMTDPRITDDCRASAHFKELLAKGVKPFWDAAINEVRWILPSEGHLECVVAEGAFESEPKSLRQRLVRDFNKRVRRYKSN